VPTVSRHTMALVRREPDRFHILLSSCYLDLLRRQRSIASRIPQDEPEAFSSV
jgi:hypothetical protein